MAQSKTKLPPFATRLTALRKKAGLTRYALAKLAGIPSQTLYRIESGERGPGWDTACALATALAVSLDDFRS